MKQKKSTGKPILSSIIWGVALTFLVSVASAISVILELSDIATRITQTSAYLVMGIILIINMTSKEKSLKLFGFKKLNISNTGKVLYYIPLLIIALVQPIMGGLNFKLTLMDILTIILFTFFVGFTEESLFRGIIKEKLKSKSTSFYIVFSSVLFGILHMANAFNNVNILNVILQVINAFLIGLILSELIAIEFNIIPLIAFHFIYDALAMMTNTNIDETPTLIVLDILYTVYAIYLGTKLKNKDNLSKNNLPG